MMIARPVRLALFACLVPQLATAGPYDGIFKQSANAECALVGADGGSLRIDENVFTGVEVECRMTRPVDVIDMDATIYTMECSGGDQIWTERVILMNDAETDGIYMIWNGYVFRYPRCAEGES